MNTPQVDWSQIRFEYEQGASKQALAAKYGITRQAIIKHARKEKWITRLVTSPDELVTSPVTREKPSNLEPDIPTLLQAALRGLAKQDPENLYTINEYKLFADALNQFHKIKLTLPQEQFAYDMRSFLRLCTPEELAIVQPVIEAVNAREHPPELQRTG